MICLQQWRSAIGLFAFKALKAKTSKIKKNSRNDKSNDLSDLCGRLFVLSIVFWSFHLEQQLLLRFLNSSFSSKVCVFSEVMTGSFCSNFELLVQASDVELNPGPGPETQSIQNQLEAFRHQLMISMNESMFKMFDELKVSQNEIKAQLSSINESVSSLKTDLHTMNMRLENVEEDQRMHRLDIDHCAETLGYIDDRLHEVEKKTEKQEQYSRRENIILHGLGEQQDESYEANRTRLTTLLNNNVKDKTWQENDIQRAHRLGNDFAKKPRPLIVRLSQFQDKLVILKARDDLKKAGIGVAGDLTTLQRSELSKLREKGQKGYYKNGVLKVVPLPPDQTSVKYSEALSRLPSQRR